MKPDIDDKLRSPFKVLRARVLAYSHPLKKYRLRPDQANYDIIECAALDVGVDCPFPVGSSVLLQRIPNQGWLIMGRIPTARNVKARTTRQLPESAGEDAGELSFQDPDNDEDLFHAQPGDLVVRQGKLKMILSKIGVFAVKVSDTCYRHMSKAKSVIIDRCFAYTLSIPRATINLFLDRQTEQPKLEAQLNPQTLINAMRLAVGGGVADDADGIDLAMGQFTRLLFQLLPAEQSLVYTQNGENTKITSDLNTFLLQFGTGRFEWTVNGLRVSKDGTSVLIDPTNLVLDTTNLTLTADNLTAEVSGTTTLSTQVLIMQQFHWLTVVNRLNSLLVAFSAHTHEGNLGVATTAPLPLPLNDKGLPIGNPIRPNEDPFSI